MATIHRLNHAVLYVGDVDTSVAFYTDVLGFEVVHAMGGAAFLRASGSDNDHDLGLFAASGAGRRDRRGAVGLYHLAWEVDTLGDLVDLATTLAEHGALVGTSDHGATKSLYARDPDGLEFEVVWLVPAHLLTDDDRGLRVASLDLDAEVARFGRDAPSGHGVSRPAPATTGRA